MAILDETGYSYNAVCKAAGVDIASIRAWKQGTHYSPNLLNFVAVANTLGYRVKLEKIDG